MGAVARQVVLPGRSYCPAGRTARQVVNHCSSTAKGGQRPSINSYFQPPSLQFQSTSSLLVRGRVHYCGHGDRHRSGGGPDTYRTLYVCQSESLVYVTYHVHCLCSCPRGRALASYWRMSPGGSTHTIKSTSTLAMSHNIRLDKTQRVSRTSHPFSTTGTDRILKRPLLRPSSMSIPSLQVQVAVHGGEVRASPSDLGHLTRGSS